jgi:hypothetical protein
VGSAVGATSVEPLVAVSAEAVSVEDMASVAEAEATAVVATGKEQSWVVIRPAQGSADRKRFSSGTPIWVGLFHVFEVLHVAKVSWNRSASGAFP